MRAAKLDREGIFKVKPEFWEVRQFDSGAVAIEIRYRVLAQLDGSIWQDWTGFDPVVVWGRHIVIKSDKTPNARTVEQLAEVLGWDGSLRGVTPDRLPDVVVQTTVKADTYNGNTTYKADWLRPENYSPEPKASKSNADVGTLDAMFGSLLRAAASTKSKPQSPKPKAAPATPAASTGQTATGAAPAAIPDDIPF